MLIIVEIYMLFGVGWKRINFLRTAQIMREEMHCHQFMGSFFLIATDLLYTTFSRWEGAYHGFCYTCNEALAGREKKLNGFTGAGRYA